MDNRAKKILLIYGGIIGVLVIAAVVFLLLPKLPSTQNSEETVIIDNFADYTEHISADSFGILGNYLYTFINKPSEKVYHAEVVENSYTYNKNTRLSKFTVAVKDSSIAWSISLQTVNKGEINGDIGVTCKSGGSACLSLSDRMNSSRKLQDLLPITEDEYIINYQTNNTDVISVVYYDRAGEGKRLALEKITSLGFKPEDYKLEFFYGGNGS